MNCCVICGKPITPQFWVCRNCEGSWNIVGVPYRDWPKWIKALVSIERRYRRHNKVVITIPIEDETVCSR